METLVFQQIFAVVYKCYNVFLICCFSFRASNAVKQIIHRLQMHQEVITLQALTVSIVHEVLCVL